MSQSPNRSPLVKIPNLASAVTTMLIAGLGAFIGYNFLPPKVLSSPVINFDPGLRSSGHKGGVGDGISAKYQESIDANSLRPSSNDVCYPKFKFFIELDCSKRDSSGDVNAKFFFFENNIQIEPIEFLAIIENDTFRDETTVFISKERYHEIETNQKTCVADFEIEASLNVSTGSNNDYNIVFFIEDVGQNGRSGVSEVDPDLENIDCSGVPSAPPTLQYFRCIKAGNTHESEHVTIETIQICNQ